MAGSPDSCLELSSDVAVKLAHVLANGAFLTLMLGHFTNDLMGGVLPMLFPDFKARFDLDNAAVGGITLAYSSASSLSQPLFGYISDRFGRRWFVPIPLVWGACFISLLGFADSFGMILILAALAGIGSGAYHPWVPPTRRRFHPSGGETRRCRYTRPVARQGMPWVRSSPLHSWQSSVRRGLRSFSYLRSWSRRSSTANLAGSSVLGLAFASVGQIIWEIEDRVRCSSRVVYCRHAPARGW